MRLCSSIHISISVKLRVSDISVCEGEMCEGERKENKEG